MLEYLYTIGNPNELKVILNGEYCGDIKPTNKNGWAYYPKGKKEHGKVFKTIQEVRNSLKIITLTLK